MLHKLSHQDALSYITAGKSLFTIKNENSGNRFTFKVKALKTDPNILFVSLLRGSDNENSYSYIGVIAQGNFKHTAKSKVTPDSQGFQSFAYTFIHLKQNTLPSFISVYHHNHCGRCGRTLTVPSSIIAGIGPECSKRM